ncbi:MAG: CheR family methyltransferase [Pseudomonadota bacterium]
MRDEECAAFLRRRLPQLGLRWAGFRKVRRTVCKRLKRRLAELDLADLAAYDACLDATPGERDRLDAMCRIPISRFYRDRGVFDCLGSEILPALAEAAAARGERLRCWSAGCASGEEPYSIRLLWEVRCRSRYPNVDCEIVATDADATMIERAQRACYSEGSLRDLPEDLRGAFVREGGQLCLPREWRGSVSFRLQDIRNEMPEGPFDLVLCRNLVLTYFDIDLQRLVVPRLVQCLVPGGAFVIGRHETLPPIDRLEAWHAALGIFRKACVASMGSRSSS